MMDRLSPAEAAMVVFIVWHMDRHSDGALLEAFDNGVIQRAVGRMLTANAAGARG